MIVHGTLVSPFTRKVHVFCREKGIPFDLARALFLEEYSDTRALEAFAPALVERVIMPRHLDGPTDEERIARTAAQVVPGVFDWLDARAEPKGLVAGRFTIADCAIGAQLQSWELAGEPVDGARWPRLRAYSDAVLARPSFLETAAAFEAEGA